MPSSYLPLSETVSAAPPSARGKLRASLIAGLLCFVVYTANFRSISVGDAYPARYLPFVMWRWHTVFFDPIVDVSAQGRIPIKPNSRQNERLWHGAQPQDAFWIVRLANGHDVSLYPLVVPVIVAPLYLPAVAYLDMTGWDPQHLDRVARIMEKVSASLLAAASAALFYLLLRRRTGPRSALFLTFAYAFGTTTWVIGSQALWQHGAGELLVVCALLLLTGKCTAGRAIAAGLVLGLMACNRPPDVLIAAPLGVYALWWARRFAPILITAALLPAVPLLVYNLGIVGHFAGAYGLIGKSSFFAHNLVSGLAGLLFSPTRGLFVFSPFLLFVPFLLPRILRDESTRGLAIAALVGVVLQLLVYARADWRQGSGWGPRWLTDLIPILIWTMSAGYIGLSKAVRAVFVLAVGAAVVIQAIGAFWFTGESTALVYAASTGPDPMQAAWQVQNTPFIAELRHAPAPFELTTDVRGFLDVMAIDYGAGGREVELAGWALAGAHTPHEVIALLDGEPAASTIAFSPRPDVTSTLGASSPSGWSLAIPASNLKQGEHVVAILARAYQGGDTRLLAVRRFTEKPDLATSASRAADMIASRQQPPGYWLTSFTGKPRWEHPGVEMNTYLPSVLVDVLGPVAKAAGLEDNLERARRFLTSQIEGNGLVRYHGLPDAPTIGTLGCAITPDSDDTSLVWRIAPSVHKELLPRALRIFDDYRTADGLYRTWLAPKDRFQCLNLGADPDPADIAIQMHVLMLLSKADPPAAKALCSALKRAVDEDRIWVYYKIAPLVPILRQADLRECGCALQVPSSRQQTPVAGQEAWISAARMLRGVRGDGSPPPAPAEVGALLQRISEDDFLYVRHSPPLLYHNDQTASLPRYYWSEEFGYALWLRLYSEYAGGGPK
ncbi:MAG: hypothetical protein ABSH09_26650 [Bryobacteraceae bacterium]